MSMKVKSNMSAVRSVNTLNKNNAALSSSLKKVASGMKINSAQDDASSYSISERMRVLMRGLDQDIQNVQNGQSLLNVAAGGVQSIVDELRTIKELALNAANDTNTDKDRLVLQKEMYQRMTNIDDIASETDYNGKKLLDGSLRAYVEGDGAIVAKTTYRKTSDRELVSQDASSERDLPTQYNGSTSFSYVSTSGTRSGAITSDNQYSSVVYGATTTIDGADSDTSYTYNPYANNADFKAVGYGEVFYVISNDSRNVTLSDAAKINENGTTSFGTTAYASTSVTREPATSNTKTSTISQWIAQDTLEETTTKTYTLEEGVTTLTTNTTTDTTAVTETWQKQEVIDEDRKAVVVTETVSELSAAKLATEIGGTNYNITAGGVYRIKDGFTGTISIGTTAEVCLIGSGVDDDGYSGSSPALNNVQILGNAGGNTNLSLKGINISNSTDQSAIKFQGSNNTLYLLGTDNEITSTASTLTKALVNTGNGLTIVANDSNGDSSSGTLKITQSNASATVRGAIVGSDYGVNGGSINIGPKVGMTISTQGKMYAADIGSGESSTVGVINFYGENNQTPLRADVSVTNNNTSYAACIGAGYNGSCGDINFYYRTRLNLSSTAADTVSPLIGSGDANSSCGTITFSHQVDVTLNKSANISYCVGNSKNTTSANVINVNISTTMGGNTSRLKNIDRSLAGSNTSNTSAVVTNNVGSTQLALSEYTYTRRVDTDLSTRTISGQKTYDVYELNFQYKQTNTYSYSQTTTETASTVTRHESFTGTTYKATDTEIKTTKFIEKHAPEHSLTIQHGTKANQAIRLHIEDMHNAAMGIDGIEITTRDKATDALDKIDAAIEYALDQSTSLGANLSRLEYTERNLTTANENTRASESVIRDADMARAMTDYTKNNVLLQASQSMLAQANQNASSVLGLLQ